MKQLGEDLELRLKVEIHELEERKNLHINNLNRTFDQKMNEWKAENINQIKELAELATEKINENKILLQTLSIYQQQINIIKQILEKKSKLSNSTNETISR